MKCISLWQPWASLWLSPRKLHETRDWSTDHRGWLLVHSTKKMVRNLEPDDPLRAIVEDEFGGHWAMDLPTGGIIGAVNVIDCLPTYGMFPFTADRESDDFQCGNFGPGRFAIRRRDFKVFTAPIPFLGRQARLLDVPDALVREAMAA